MECMDAQYKMRSRGEWIDAKAYYTKPIFCLILSFQLRKIILILGTGNAWDETVKFFIEQDCFNILHVIYGAMPNLQSIFCENLDFNWASRRNYYMCHGCDLDHVQTFIKIIDPEDPEQDIEHILVYPGNVHNDQRDEVLDDCHAFAAIDKIQYVYRAIGKKKEKQPTIQFNIENGQNLAFFTGLKGCELQSENDSIVLTPKKSSTEVSLPSTRLSNSKTPSIIYEPSSPIKATRDKNNDDLYESYYSSSNEEEYSDNIGATFSTSSTTSSDIGVAVTRSSEGLHKIIAGRAKFSEPIKILTSSVVHGGLCFVDSMLTFLAYNKNIASFLV